MTILMGPDLNLGAVVLHSDRDQTTAAIPFRSVDEWERE